MGRPLSVDLRSRLLGAIDGGPSRRAAAERFGVSAASAVRRVHALDTTGPLAFARLKALLRRAAARTRKTPWSTVSQFLGQSVERERSTSLRRPASTEKLKSDPLRICDTTALPAHRDSLEVLHPVVPAAIFTRSGDPPDQDLP